jgi:hypothetical protein
MKKGLAIFRLEAMPDTGDDVVPVQIANGGIYRGYQGGEQEFTFDWPFFGQLVLNFHQGPNYHRGPDGRGDRDVIAWDFHHASEMPAAAVGVGGAPAQGWIQELEVRTGPGGVPQLWAWTRWLEPARTYIKEGRYRWASVSVVFDAVDAVTGKVIGPLLTSVALTNQPFIEGMMPLAASRNAAAHHHTKGPTTMKEQIYARARQLRATGTPTDSLALAKATAELHPHLTNDERYLIWAPLLRENALKRFAHAARQPGAQLVRQRRTVA